MKVVLLSPPGLTPFAPPLSIMALASYLRKEGIEVLAIDASIEFIHYSLFPDRLKNKLELATLKLLFGPELPYPLKERIEKISNQIDRNFDLIKDIWSEDGFNIDKNNFETAIEAINNALFFVSLTNLPTIYSLNYIYSRENILHNELENPFLEYYQKKLIPVIEKFQPDLIGISYSYNIQMFPGLFLSNEILNQLKVPIVSGGSFFSMIYKERVDTISANKKSQEDIIRFLHPFGIYGEGEEPLLQLCKCIEKHEQYFNIPGLINYDKALDALKINHHSQTIATDKLPLIDLNVFPIGKKYLSPIGFTPLMSSRGCYWNKCAFCGLTEPLGSIWRELPKETIIQNIKLYKEQYGIDSILFTDEAMSPSMLKCLSERILQDGLKINFGTMMRFEKGLLNIINVAAKAGCKFLSFGFESGCPRILSKMRKGYLHETAEHILDKCSKNGISVALNVMFGFPSETIDEAQETISFLERNSNNIAIIRATAWYLMIGSDIYNNMEYYGIVPNEGGVRAGDPSTYTVNDGITYKQASEIVNSLYSNPVIGEKVIRYGAEGFSEEYYLCKKIFVSNNR